MLTARNVSVPSGGVSNIVLWLRDVVHSSFLCRALPRIWRYGIVKAVSARHESDSL